MITPERGKVYIVKHSSGMIEARFICERVTNFPHSKRMTHYVFQNVRTGRDIEIKSRIKIRREVAA